VIDWSGIELRHSAGLGGESPLWMWFKTRGKRRWKARCRLMAAQLEKEQDALSVKMNILWTIFDILSY